MWPPWPPATMTRDIDRDLFSLKHCTNGTEGWDRRTVVASRPCLEGPRMDQNTVYKTHPEVVSTQTGDELVLLSFKTDTYYGLNPVGLRIWELLGEGASVNTLCATLGAEYDVSEEVLRRDILTVMSDLDAQSLIVAQEA